MQTLLIIDATNLLFRSYHAITAMTGADGESTHALFGFIRSLERLLTKFSPQYCVAVFDGPDNKKRRTELYREYKIHRAETPADIFPQMQKAMDFCNLSGIPMLSVCGVEADDTIATIVHQTNGAHLHRLIVSSDKDLCQLVSPSCSIVHAHKNDAIVNEEGVKTLFGVPPSQILDYLSLIGDASDNIPGVAGIGPKTAISLLETYGSLKGILLHLDAIPASKRDLLLKDKHNALLSQQLATLHVDVDIPQDLTFYTRQSADAHKLQNFYRDHRFFSLLKKEDLPKAATDYQLIDTPDALENFFQELSPKTSLCILADSPSCNPKLASLHGIAIGYEKHKAGYISCSGFISKETVIQFLQKLFSKENLQIYGHDIKTTLHALINEGILLPKWEFDTAIASYLLCPHITDHGLERLSLEYLSHHKTAKEDLLGKGKNKVAYADLPPTSRMAYYCESVDCTMQLKEIFTPKLIELELSDLLQTIELPLIASLLAMEQRGIFLDCQEMDKVAKNLEEQLSSLSKDIHEIAGEEFNINSPKQLSKVLFETLALPPPKKTQTGFSTNAEVLESLSDKSPIIPTILSYRQLEKLRSTYAQALPAQVHPLTHRIHCTFNQLGTSTGRLSCQDPNLQNIPVRTEEGKKIRAAFRPQKEGWSYLSADYSQIELRLLAHFSEDPMLMEAFLSGADVHQHTASLIFNTPLDQVTPQMRYRAKAVNFGILYGQQAFGLSQNLGISQQEAATFIATYFQRYERVKEFIEECKATARKTGKTLTITGRQRPIPEIHSDNPSLKSLGERLAVNTPLQGTAADLIKIAMIHLSSTLQNFESFPILQIHDELLFECPDQELRDLGSLVKKAMEGAISLKIPLLVDISIGKNWGEC